MGITEQKEKGSAAEAAWEAAGSPCFNACCPLENKQTSDYDINANLNASQ